MIRRLGVAGQLSGSHDKAIPRQGMRWCWNNAGRDCLTAGDVVGCTELRGIRRLILAGQAPFAGGGAPRRKDG